MRITIIAILILSNFSVVLSQQNDLFEAKEKTENGITLPYRLLSPDAAIKEKVPVVLFLHGAGERGTNNVAQLTHVMSDFVTQDARDQFPCYIIAPQCPKDNWWTAGAYNPGWNITWADEPSQIQKIVMSILKEVMEMPNVDLNRIYIGGLSMGGMGTWDLLAHYPNTFAAAFPICGWGNPQYASKIKDVPIWAFHGTNDQVVPVSGSKNIVEAIRKVGGSPILTLYKGVGHNSWTIPFHEQTHVFDWLFAQSK